MPNKRYDKDWHCKTLSFWPNIHGLYTANCSTTLKQPNNNRNFYLEPNSNNDVITVLTF